MPKRATTIRLDDPTLEEIRRCADEIGISSADFIRQAIFFYLGYLHGRQNPPELEQPELPE